MRVDAVHFRRGEQRGDRRPGPPTTIGAGEQCILARNGLRSDRAFDDVGVDLDTAIGKEALERSAAAQGVADGLGQLGFARQAWQFLFEHGEQLGHDGVGAFCPDAGAQFGSMAADILLDRPEGRHGPEHGSGEGRAIGRMPVEELAARVGPAASQADVRCP